MVGGHGQEIMNATPPDLTPHTNEDDRVVLLPSSSQVHTSKSAWEAVRVVKASCPLGRTTGLVLSVRIFLVGLLFCGWCVTARSFINQR